MNLLGFSKEGEGGMSKYIICTPAVIRSPFRINVERMMIHDVVS